MTNIVETRNLSKQYPSAAATKLGLLVAFIGKTPGAKWMAGCVAGGHSGSSGRHDGTHLRHAGLHADARAHHAARVGAGELSGCHRARAKR